MLRDSSAQHSASHYQTLMCDLARVGHVDPGNASHTLQAMWRLGTLELISSVDTRPKAYPFGQGPDGDRLLALGKRVRSLLAAAPDVRDNDDDWVNKIVKVAVEIDQDRARQLGVTSEEVARLLNTYFSRTAVSIYREGDNAIPIVLRAGAYTSQGTGIVVGAKEADMLDPVGRVVGVCS
jgi:Cu/Ag efflux pump CusA